MATVTRSTPIVHYAYYGDTYGTATLLNGSGYLFRADGQRQAVVVSYKRVFPAHYGERRTISEGY